MDDTPKVPRRWLWMVPLVCAPLFVSQLYATNLLPETRSVERPQQAQPSGADRVRRARPSPGVLTTAVEWEQLWIGSGSPVPEPKGPIRITSNFGIEIRSRISSQPKANPTTVKVIGTVVNLRAAPNLAADRLGQFSQGTQLRILERRAGWTRIQDPVTNSTGWMHGEFLSDETAVKMASSGGES
jgi:hypothetical protein